MSPRTGPARPGSVRQQTNCNGPLPLVSASLVFLWHWSVRFHDRHGVLIRTDGVRGRYRRRLAAVGIAAAGVALAWVSPWISYAACRLTPIGYIVDHLRRSALSPHARPAAGR